MGGDTDISSFFKKRKPGPRRKLSLNIDKIKI
jgi:hypothetical protein